MSELLLILILILSNKILSDLIEIWQNDCLLKHFEQSQETITCFKSTIATLEKDVKSELTINTPEQRQWRRFAVFIVNFEYISNLILMLFLLIFLIFL